MNLPKKAVTFKIKNESDYEIENEELKLRFSPTCHLRDFIYDELGFSDPNDRPILKVETSSGFHIQCDYDELDDGAEYILNIFDDTTEMKDGEEQRCRFEHFYDRQRNRMRRKKRYLKSRLNVGIVKRVLLQIWRLMKNVDVQVSLIEMSLCVRWKH